MVREIEATKDALGRCDPVNAGRVLQKSPQTLANWRTLGIGPKHLKVGGRIYYLFDDLVAYGRGETETAQAA